MSQHTTAVQHMAPVATSPVLKFSQPGEGKAHQYLSFMGWGGASAERESRLWKLKGYEKSLIVKLIYFHTK